MRQYKRAKGQEKGQDCKKQRESERERERARASESQREREGMREGDKIDGERIRQRERYPPHTPLPDVILI